MGFASCAGLVEVSGETWNPVVAKPRFGRDLVGAPVPAVEQLCQSMKTCDDGTVTYLGPRTADITLHRIKGIPLDQALAREQGGVVTVYVPGTGNVDDPLTGQLSPELRRLLR